MAGFKRSVHPQAGITWKKLKQLAPDITIEFENGEEPMGLAFVDPDQECHIYVFTEEGKQQLLRQLTGGLIVPKSRNGG